MTITDYISEYGLVTTILGGLMVIVLYVHFWWTKSYFEEKGRNLATKEDIAEITQITETIKGDLDVLSKNKYSLIEERRRVILKLIELIQSYEHIILYDTKYLETNDLNPNAIYLALYKLENTINELDLYNDNERVMKDLTTLILCYKDAIESKTNYKEEEYKRAINAGIMLRQQIFKKFKETIRTDLT